MVPLGFEKLREATQHKDDTLATIIVPLANMMLHKTCTLPTGEKVVEKVLPMGTKWKAFLLDANAVGENASLEPILLSKLSMMKKENFSDYIRKR